jgi:branched-chain amino acid transport system substrate-binding protein
MRRRTWIALALSATAALALAVVGATSAAHSTRDGAAKASLAMPTIKGRGGFAGATAKGKPILIGAAVDLTKNMAPFDAPALAAAQIEIKKINAAGGVLGRPLQIIPINDQLDPTKTQQAAAQLVGKHVAIGWVTCDVDFSTPSIDEFLKAKLLTVAPCIGTDEMGPSRFGSPGKLAFSFGNAAQDEGAGVAEYAISRGWKNATVVTDNLLRYFQDVCKAFTVRFQQLGGKIVAQEGFTQFQNQINTTVSRVNNEKSDVIAFCTSFAVDQPAFVSGLRSLHNNTPIIDGWGSDGSYWWPQNPPVTNFYYLTFASPWGDDPSKQIRAFEAKMKAAGHPAQTGGFLGGAAAIQGIAHAINLAHGSTNGAKLARVMVKFHKFPTISGKVSFSAGLHTVFGRRYRVILVNNNKAKYVGSITASSPANIGR